MGAGSLRNRVAGCDGVYTTANGRRWMGGVLGSVPVYGGGLFPKWEQPEMIRVRSTEMEEPER